MNILYLTDTVVFIFEIFKNLWTSPSSDKLHFKNIYIEE